MKIPISKSQRGFSLLELMIASAVGLIAVVAMTQLFNMGMNATFTVTQRAETQQNMRAAIELMTKDISMAGAGLPAGGLQLANAGGAARVACNQAGTCYVPGDVYPNSGAGVQNYMYGLLPGFANGVQAAAVITSAPAAVNDSITSIYCDYNFPLFEYNVTFPLAPDGTQINLTVNSAYTANPPPLPTAAGGIQNGDLILINGSNGVAAVGEVTNVTATSLSFANLDPLNMNFSGPTHTNNVYAVSGGTGYAYPPPALTTQGTAYRLFAVTYYLTVPGAGQTPRLMRQVNGLTPVPVADDIINLQVAYDTYNSGVLDANQANPLGVGESPNNIQKINLLVMGQSIINNGNKSQNMYLATDVSARNMAFRNRYQ